MRFPDFLKSGDRIGAIAPSFGCAGSPYREGLDSARKKLEDAGFPVVCGPGAYRGDGVGISAPPEECAAEFMQFWCGSEAEALISCGGGELMCEILPYIDFEKAGKAAPKWFMGYSDNTNLTFTLTTLCDTAAVYGPCISAFGMEPWHASLQDALDLLKGKKTRMEGYPLYETESLKDEEHPLVPYNVTEPVRRLAWNEKGERTSEITLKGRLTGGCLDCLCNLAGTRFDRVREYAGRYKDDGILWFLEACDLNVFGIRRALWNLKEAGWFEHASGFLIGRPYCNGQEIMGLDQYEAVLSPLRALGVPIIMDLDIGHLPPMMPVVSGSLGTAELKEGQFRLDMKMK